MRDWDEFIIDIEAVFSEEDVKGIDDEVTDGVDGNEGGLSNRKGGGFREEDINIVSDNTGDDIPEETSLFFGSR